MDAEERRPRFPARRWLPLLLVALLALIFVVQRQTPDDAGELNPVVTAEFPANVEAGSVHTATISVQNPSATDIDNVFISFSTLGAAGGEDFPTPIVGGPTVESGSPIVSIEPKPSATGGGVRFGFGELAAGEELSVDFELRVPEATGPAANSIVVYDGTVPDRAGGSKIETIVES